MKQQIIDRVAALRQWMSAQGIDCLVVPTADPHDSEYLPARWQTRQWLTGFTGSAGLALLAHEGGWLWTDSRYFLQAEQELAGTPFHLMREGEADVPTPAQWLESLAQNLSRPLTVGYVPEMTSLDLFESLQAKNLVLQPTADPFDLFWTDRPERPQSTIVVQAEADAGQSVADKLRQVRQRLTEQTETAAWGCLLNDLSEIAWLLNIRGADVDYNPFVLAYFLLTPSGATLFVDAAKVSDAARAHFVANDIAVQGYEDWADLTAYGLEELLLPRGMNCAVLQCSRGYERTAWIDSPIPLLRAVKNAAEVDGFRRSMERDGVAMVRFMRWLDEAMATGQQLTEYDVHLRLTALRAENDRFCSLSFPTIAAYGPNGAIVHYEPEAETATPLAPRGLLLLDSGAQYEDGTTDITRTIALGPLTDEERRVYTLVLRAHIALALGTYPEGAVGLQIDAVGRSHLWQYGLDFGHGTGHGVGSRLGVHEGPHQIRKNVRACTLVPFRPGMVVTNEPGVYCAGAFGVRLENVLLALPIEETAQGRFFRFETLTLCPFDTRPIDHRYLLPEHIQWLNDYHAHVRARLMPLLSSAEDVAWLMQATQPLEVGD